MGWRAVTVITPLVIIEGAGGGEFVYDSSGNLRAANVGATTTDPIQGITCQQGISTFNGHGAVISLQATALDAYLLYADTGTSTQGALIVSEASAAGTDPFGNPFAGPGIVSYGNVLTFYALLNAARMVFADTVNAAFSGGIIGLTTVTTSDDAIEMLSPLALGTDIQASLILQRAATPGPAHAIIGNSDLRLSDVASVTPSGGAALRSHLGTPAWTDSAGGQWNNAGAQQDTANTTVTQASFATLTKIWSIPAGEPQVGTAYRIVTFGFATWGSTAQALTVALALAGVNVTGSVVIPAATFAVNQGLRWRCVAELIIISTGAGGTCQVNLAFTINNPAALGIGATAGGIVSSTSAQAINTTVANNLNVEASWASTTGAPTITSTGSRFEKAA